MSGPASRRIPILQVDAFTSVPFAGNPAGVVLDGAGLDDEAMQLIAREMNLSETAFLLPASGSGADLRVRWMTPTTEVDLCGHATVATFHAALEEGRLAPGDYRMECRSGILPIGLRRAADGSALVRMGLPVPDLESPGFETGRLAEPLGLRTGDLSSRLPVARTGEWLLAPVGGLDALRRARPDFRTLRALGSEVGAGCFIALTTETVDPASAIHLRMFAPAFGIDEDPVTGSAQGPVAAWMAASGLLRAARYVAEQGDIIGRPGRIEVEVGLEAGRLESIAIIGRAVTVLRGALSLPPLP